MICISELLVVPVEVIGLIIGFYTVFAGLFACLFFSALAGFSLAFFLLVFLPDLFARSSGSYFMGLLAGLVHVISLIFPRSMLL